MKTCLLDVNVLLALAWPHHIHHLTVHGWWEANHPGQWASCTQTQLGFIRVSCNPRFALHPASPAQSSAVLQQMTSRPDHRFWPEIPEPHADPGFLSDLPRLTTHGQITDAYLASLARHHNGCLLTLDRSLRSIHPDVAILADTNAGG